MSAIQELRKISSFVEVISKEDMLNLLSAARLRKDKPEFYKGEYYKELTEEEKEIIKGFTTLNLEYAHILRSNIEVSRYLPYTNTFNFGDLGPCTYPTETAAGYRGYIEALEIGSVLTEINTTLRAVSFPSIGFLDIFQRCSTSDNRLDQSSKFFGTSTTLVFDSCFNEKEEQNTSDVFSTYTFPDFPRCKEKVLLDVDGIRESACLYRTEQAHTMLVVPMSFYRIFEGCNKKAKHQDRLKVILHKLSLAVDKALNTPERKRQRIQSEVSTALTDYYKNAITNKVNQLRQVENQRDTYKEEYLRSYRMSNLVRMELEGLRGSTGKISELSEVLKEQLSEVYKVNKIKSISYIAPHLIFETNFLHFLNPDTNVLHQLGEMTIKVDINTFHFSFKNNSMRYLQIYDHPHIANGTVCFGNFGVGLPELLMEGQVYTFIDLVVAFLETCNPKDEWGKNAIYWPVADDSKASETWPEIRKRISGNTMPKIQTDLELLDEVKESIEATSPGEKEVDDDIEFAMDYIVREAS